MSDEILETKEVAQETKEVAQETKEVGQEIEEAQEKTEETQEKTISKSLNNVSRIPIDISVVLGSSDIKIQDLLSLEEGAVLELNKNIGEQVEIYANKRLIARGELISAGDKLAVSMTEITRTSGEIEED